jgi:3-oxoacid CoA-transferase B subunit
MHYKHRIAWRAAREIKAGQIINLGIGIPTLIMDYLPDRQQVFVHSENGIWGMGPRAAAGREDPDLIDAGAAYATIVPGAAFFDTLTSFAIIRGGRIDLAFLGALQVAQNGDLANWIIPGQMTPGIGGGMELAQKSRKVIVLTTHVTKTGAPKIVKSCSLPLTAPACVAMIITDRAVIEVTDAGLCLKELAEGVSVADVVAATEAPLLVPEGELPRF